MLTLFPSLLTYQLLAPFLLRLILGALFIKYGYYKIFTDHSSVKILGLINKNQTPSSAKIFSKAMGVVEAICGAMLVVGLFTQLAAGIIALLMIAALAIKVISKDEILKDDYDFYFLCLGIALSLIFLGAGIFSVDLPL